MFSSDEKEPAYLEGKRALVIDDMGAAVVIGKNMLLALGAKQVDTAGDYKTAFPMIARKHYDLVLCDFNLGSGLNGQQLLRDLRHIKRISYQTLFVVVSAERTRDIVLGTIECEPDGYIAKPFTQGDFKMRIIKLTEQQKTFREVNIALDDGTYDLAFSLLDGIRETEPRYRSLALRKRAGILYEQKRFDEALAVFDTALEVRRPTWAQIGRARCIAEMGDRQQAIIELEEIIRNNPLAVPAMDSLAICHLRDGRKREAQQIVENSIAISPMSIERQRWLGDLSMEVGEVSTALKAYRATLNLAADTLKENAKQHDTFARTIRKAIESETDIKICGELIVEGKKCLKAARKKYEGDVSLHLNESLLRSLERFRQDKSEEAIAVIDAAIERHKELIEKDPELVIDIAETRFYTGDLPGAEMMLRKLMIDNPGNQRLLDRIQAIIDTPIPYHKRVLLNELNRQGKQHYDAADYEKALKAFREALRVYPYHPAVNLNAVQVTLKLIELGARSMKAMSEAKDYLAACVNLEEEHPEYKRKEAFSRYLNKQLK
jgi:tetratricopeptide (TPR) repeat protein